MIRQTVLEFKVGRTEEQLTAHACLRATHRQRGLSLMAEYNHGLGLRQLADQYLPEPGSNRGYAPSAFVDSLVLLLQAEYTLDADRSGRAGGSLDLPMLGFLFETPVCLCEEFREGNVPPQAGQLSFYRGCKARMPAGKRIRSYRADSVPYQAELINELEADGVYWAITADQDRAVKEAIRRISEADWKEPTGDCGYEVAETVYTLARTDNALRLIVKRELRRQQDLFEGEGQYGYQVVASN